jgi:PadR family transcriptional regulator PadR
MDLIPSYAQKAGMQIDANMPASQDFCVQIRTYMCVGCTCNGPPWRQFESISSIVKLAKFIWILHRSGAIFFAMAKGATVDADKSEVLQGTLDLMILKTLQALGPLHGFGIARRIEQVSEDVLTLNEGTVYTSLLRLQQQGWIDSKWGTSENNRKARFYSITRRGQKQLAVETENWERISGVIGRVLRLEGKQL